MLMGNLNNVKNNLDKNGNRNRRNKPKNRFLKFLSSDPVFGGVLVFIIFAITTTMLTMIVHVTNNYERDKIQTEVQENLQTLKAIDEMMVGKMNLADKLTYLNQMASHDNFKVGNMDGQVSLAMQMSKDECQAFFNQFPNYIDYRGYSLVINNVDQSFNPFEPIAQEMNDVMCSKSNNTIIRHYYILNNDIIDFSDLRKSASQNDDNSNANVNGNDAQSVDSSAQEQNAPTQINNNISQDGGITQTITIDNGNVHVVINTNVGTVVQDDNSSDSDDNADDNSSDDSTPAPCFPGQKGK